MPCGTRRAVEGGGLTLALAEWGGAENPPLILLHSLAAHSHWWDWAAPLWAGRWRLVALDFRGHGASAHVSPPAYSFDDHVADVVAVLDALDVERAVVIGHSLGGYVGARTAARHPGRVLGLVIADMLTAWTADHEALAARQIARPPAEFPSAEEAAARFKLQPPDTRAPAERVRHLGEAGLRVMPSGGWALAFDRAVFGHPRVEPWSFLPDVRCPTLVIHGERSGIMGRQAAERVGATLPRGTVRTLPGAFHHLMVDGPEEFVAAVDEWMAAAGPPEF